MHTYIHISRVNPFNSLLITSIISAHNKYSLSL